MKEHEKLNTSHRLYCLIFISFKHVRVEKEEKHSFIQTSNVDGELRVQNFVAFKTYFTKSWLLGSGSLSCMKAEWLSSLSM
jgi:hypothetical protein